MGLLFWFYCILNFCVLKLSLLQLHAAVFLWGFTGVLGRTIQLNAVVLVWYRLLITVLTLLLWLFATRQLPRLHRQTVLQLLGIGALVALHWVLFYGSIKCSNVSITLTCLSSAGFFTALIEPLLLRKTIQLREVGLGCLGIFGIILIFHFDPSYQLGIVIGLGAAITSVIFSILNKQMLEKVPPKPMIMYELGGGWLVLSLFMPVLYGYQPHMQWYPALSDWLWLLLLSWLCTIVAMDLSLKALKHLSVFTQNLTLNLEPVYGMILAFAIYHENQLLSKGFYVGFGLIVLSVLLQMRFVVKKHQTPLIAE